LQWLKKNHSVVVAAVVAVTSKITEKNQNQNPS
jgi:hypothetical protein